MAGVVVIVTQCVRMMRGVLLLFHPSLVYFVKWGHGLGSEVGVRVRVNVRLKI